MAFNLKYHIAIKRVDLPKIDARNRLIIKTAIEDRLVSHPEIYGKPLRRTLKGYWKLRVGNYRVVFKISGNEIFIFGIIHRRKVYQQVKKRIAS